MLAQMARGSMRGKIARLEEAFTGRSILIIVWHLLADTDTHFADLGADFYDRRISNSRKMRNHIASLEALGYKVTIQPAA